MRADTFSPGLRRAATALWGAGAGLAAATGITAVTRSMVGYGVLYALVASALAALAAALHRGYRWAEIITLGLLGGQVIGLVGATWELAYGADDTAKARHLHDLGLNYRWALAANVAYSALGSGLFVWALRRTVRS